VIGKRERYKVSALVARHDLEFAGILPGAGVIQADAVPI